MPEGVCAQCRGWLDDDMVWNIPEKERAGHVCNPWFWMPDTDIRDIAIQIRSIDEIMDHLRTIPKEILDRLLLPAGLSHGCIFFFADSPPQIATTSNPSVDYTLELLQCFLALFHGLQT